MHAALLILANDVSRRTGLVLQAPAPGGRCGPGTVGTLVSRPFWTLHTRAGCHHTPARPPDGVPGMLRHNGPSDADRSPRSEPGRRLMTGSIPRLVGYATVGAGVAAVGYVGLVTGACPIDLGIGRRVRPLGPQLVDMAALPRGRLRRHRRAVSGPGPTGAGRQAPGAGTRPRHGPGRPLHPPRGAAGPGRADGGDGPVHPAPAGRVPAGPRAGPPCRGGVRADRAGRWGEHAAGLPRGDRGRPVAPGPALVCAGRGRWEQTVAASLAAVKAEAERRASSVRGRQRQSPDQPPPPTG
jgi:hypothetical protein